MDISKNKTEFEYERMWQYFVYHASQRLIVFRFFIVLAGVIISGLITLFVKFSKITQTVAAASYERSSAFINVQPFDVSKDEILLILFSLSLLLLIHTIIFWVLDYRNTTIIELTKKEIIDFENKNDLEHKFFNKIEDDTIKSNRIRFKHCFYLVFIVFVLVSCIGLVWSICNLCS